MTRRVDIVLRICDKNAKKIKNEVTGTEKHRFWLTYLKTLKKKNTFLSPVTSILTLMEFSKKCARVNRPFRSFCLV